MSAESVLQKPRLRTIGPPLFLLDKANVPATSEDKIQAINKLYVAGIISDAELAQAQKAFTLIRTVQQERHSQKPVKRDIPKDNTELFNAVKKAGYAFLELSARTPTLDENPKKTTDKPLDEYGKKAVVVFFRSDSQEQSFSDATNEDLQRIIDEGQEALSLITEKNKGLVTKVASRIRRSSQFEWEDIMSAANIALMEAVVRYDPSRGSFSNYATQVIKGRILDEARRADSISRSTRQKAQQIQKTEDIFLQEQGRTPTIEELEEATGMQLKTITETRIMSSTRNDSIENLLENTGMQPEQPDSDPLHHLLQSEDITEKNQMLNGAIRLLNPREQQIIALYYFESLTMKEISERLGVSESRICQLHAKALGKIRDYNEYLSRKDNPIPTQTKETTTPVTTKPAEESIIPEGQKPTDGPEEKKVDSSDLLKLIRQSVVLPHPRISSEEPEPEEIELEEINVDDFPLNSFSDNFGGEEIVIWERKKPTPQPQPEHDNLPSIVYKKAKAPNGREMNLRPQENAIYSLIMAGKSQQEIIEDVFQGNTANFFSYFSNLIYELGKYGYDIIPNLTRENGKTTTTYSFEKKVQQKPKPEKVEGKKPNYLILTEKDIENIITPSIEDRTLTTADFRVLVALMKASKSILMHRLAEIISPNKISGFSEEVSSLPSRVEFYNRVVFKDEPIRIRPKSGDDQDPGGYYVSSTLGLSLDQKIGLLTRRVEQMEKAPKKQDEYSIQTQSGYDGSISLSIAKNGKKAEPVVLKDIVFEDNLSAQRHLGNDEAGSTITYHLKASNQAKIFGLLFQNNPIATRIIRMRLADDKDGISQRELQLYIDALNGTLPKRDEEDGYKKHETNNGNSLKKLGLCIIETSFNNDPSITLVKYAPETFSPVNLPGQYDTTLVGEETAKRQRKRKPSHGKQRL